VLWLEVLLEAGEAFVASRLSELPEDLLTLALHEQVLVLEVDALADRMLDDGDPDELELLDKALTSCLYEELDEYQLIARHPEGWDAVLSAVLALDRDHGALLRRVLDRCVAMSSEYIDDNGGLYEVLTSEDMLGEDVAAEREGRRAASGYVAPADATSFLKLAVAGATGEERDPVTRAWFRELSRKPGKPVKPTDYSGRLRRILETEGMVERGMPLLTGGDDDKPSSRARTAARRGLKLSPELIVEALRFLAEQSTEVFDARQEELAYLANVLVAGATIEGRRVRPVEAIRAAMGVIAVGLDQEPARQSKALAPEAAAAVLATTTLDALFRAGWARLHGESAGAGRRYSHNDLDVLQRAGLPRRAGRGLAKGEKGPVKTRLSPYRKGRGPRGPE